MMDLLTILPLDAASSWTSATTGIVDVAYRMRHTIASSGGSAMGAVAVSVAAILALFSLVKSATAIMGGKQTGIWEVLKPFVIIICVWQFDTVVAGPIDLISNSISNSLGTAVASTSVENDATMAEICAQYDATKSKEETNASDVMSGLGSFGDLSPESTKSGNRISQGTATTEGYSLKINSSSENLDGGTESQVKSESEKEDGLVSKFTTKFGAMMAQFTGRACKGLLSAVTWLIRLIFQISCVVMKVAAQFMLCLLSILGRFILALSILPQLNNFWKWAAKYIEISMWTPLVSIIYMMYQEMQAITNDTALGIAATSWGNIAEQACWMLITSLAGLASIAMIRHTRDMAGALIAGGSVAVGAALKGDAAQAAGAGKSAAKGTVSAVKGGAKLLGKLFGGKKDGDGGGSSNENNPGPSGGGGNTTNPSAGGGSGNTTNSSASGGNNQA